MAAAKAHRFEWLLLSLLLAACLALGWLQYRWTGELSRAESVRLRASAGLRLEQLARSFDNEVRQAVLDRVPEGEEVKRFGADRANEERLRQALENSSRPIFRRTGAAIPGKGGLAFHEAVSGRFEFRPAEWPSAPEWQALKARIEKVAAGHPPDRQMIDPATLLIEVPVFYEESEVEWIVLELDPDYAVKKWLPELIRQAVNPEAEPAFLVSIRNRASGEAVFGEKTPASVKPDAEAAMFPLRYRGGRDGRGGRGGRGPAGRWSVALRHVAGSVDQAALQARRRNFAAAAALLGLIALAGGVLLRYSARSRALKDAQFDFFAALSHELRTPLTVIQGAGHNLLSGVVRDDGQRESYVRAIVRQSQQLGEMVDQLLSYGSVRGGNGRKEPHAVSLSVCVSEAIETVAHELEKAGRPVDVDVPADLPPVAGVEAELCRVFTNLIMNAIRHGGGDVSVTAEHSGSYVDVHVADSGEGIPAAEIRRVFDPFFRGERARAGRVRGTGLGLSLVKDTVEAYGGSVTATSTPGKGTVLTLRLRVAE